MSSSISSNNTAVEPQKMKEMADISTLATGIRLKTSILSQIFQNFPLVCQ